MKPVHTPSHLSAAVSAPFEKRKRSTETEGADGQVDVQKQLLEVMSDMRVSSQSRFQPVHADYSVR